MQMSVVVGAVEACCVAVGCVRVAEWALPRYKIMVQVVVGEQKGEGVRMGTRCLWDAATDTLASETFMTVGGREREAHGVGLKRVDAWTPKGRLSVTSQDALFAVATVYAVYLY